MRAMTTAPPVPRHCIRCGQPIDAASAFCPHCGATQSAAAPGATAAPPIPGQVPYARHNRLAAALFAIFLGGLGIHKFYLGRILQGVIYILFCWTFLPSVIGLIEGIVYLTMSDEAFAAKYG